MLARVEVPISIEDPEPDYYELSLLVNKNGPKLSDDTTLEALINWRNEDTATRYNRRGQGVKEIDKPLPEWVAYVKSLKSREQQMIMVALGAATRSKIENEESGELEEIINLKQIRKIPQNKLENLKQNNRQRIGPKKAEFLKNAFSVPKTIETTE